MPDAGRQIREVRVPRNVELTPLKNKMSKNKTKTLKKGTKRIGESKKKIWKKRWIKRQWKNDLWSDHPEIQFGPIIFSFETMNPGLYYVPEKSILIKRGYLDWRAFSLRKFFVINEGCGLLSSAKILDKPFTCSGWIFKCIIGQSKKWKMKKKKWL